MTNILLPFDLKRAVEDVAMEIGFQGLCWSTWKELVGRNTNHINSITEAKVEMDALAFKLGETILQFLQSFKRIVSLIPLEDTGFLCSKIHDISMQKADVQVLTRARQ